MSRRRGEFEHRTSIFEGAFRAWSHLGGLDPEDLETRAAADLDPLTNPIENDPRDAKEMREASKGQSGAGGAHAVENMNPDGTKRRFFPYEPLPRSGLAHPYVQAILSPWLGPDADNDAIQLGLTTLRTWWQHRRKGESGSAVAALSTDKMRGVVEGYTRHFYTLAHCLVMNDKEQPPRSLHTKMKELEKSRNKRNKKRAREDQAGKLAAMALSAHAANHQQQQQQQQNNASGGYNDGLNSNNDPSVMAAAVAANAHVELSHLSQDTSHLTPLERLHAAQRRQLAESGGIHTVDGTAIGGLTNTTSNMSDINSVPLIPLKGKCMPGKINLPAVVDAVNHHAMQVTHRGATIGSTNNNNMNSGRGGMNKNNGSNMMEYGDPNSTPVVFVSHNGDIQIAMSVDGITCAHCVKIVETVLKGCNGNKSPIVGLVDAAADRVLCKVLIKIAKSSYAKRVAFEATRNLAMVGYTAKPMEMSIINMSGNAANNASRGNNGCCGPVDAQGDNTASTVLDTLSQLSTAFEVVATTDPQDVFDWNIKCTCPDNGILRDDCSRHSQMNTRIFDAFVTRERQVSEYMAGCGQKYGMPCSCGPDCRCANCSEHCKKTKQNSNLFSSNGVNNMQYNMDGDCCGGDNGINNNNNDSDTFSGALQDAGSGRDFSMMGSSRNPSIISFGGNMRHMSITSEATFGRAMSGLSALSIDWENMEDFDVNVDHSAHIDNNTIDGNVMDGNSNSPSMYGSGGAGGSLRRSSLRRSLSAMNAAAAAAAALSANGTNGEHDNDSVHASSTQVSFKV